MNYSTRFIDINGYKNRKSICSFFKKRDYISECEHTLCPLSFPSFFFLIRTLLTFRHMGQDDSNNEMVLSPRFGRLGQTGSQFHCIGERF